MLDIIRHVERHWSGLSAGFMTAVEDYPGRIKLEGFNSPEITSMNEYKDYFTIDEVKARIEFLQQVLKDIETYEFFDTDEKAFGKGKRYDYD